MPAGTPLTVVEKTYIVEAALRLHMDANAIHDRYFTSVLRSNISLAYLHTLVARIRQMSSEDIEHFLKPPVRAGGRPRTLDAADDRFIDSIVKHTPSLRLW